MKVIVNGRSLTVDGAELSFDQVVALAGEQGLPSIAYRGGVVKPQGTLASGETVRIRDGAVFNVCHTGNA